MAFEKGNDIRVSIGEILIGGQQGCSINMETETTETTTKDRSYHTIQHYSTAI